MCFQDGYVSKVYVLKVFVFEANIVKDHVPDDYLPCCPKPLLNAIMFRFATEAGRLSPPGPVPTLGHVRGRGPQAKRSGRDGAKRKVTGGEQTPRVREAKGFRPKAAVPRTKGKKPPPTQRQHQPATPTGNPRANLAATPTDNTKQLPQSQP